MIVYTIRNKVNGKMYVGQSIKPVEQRWAGHVRHAHSSGRETYFYRAIRKYGPENFEIIGLLEIGESQQHQPDILNQLEIGMIARLDTTNSSIGYNSTSGGESSSPTAEVRARMSASIKKAKEAMGHERLVAIAKKRAENMGSERRSAVARKRVEAMGPARRSAAARKRAELMGPERLSAVATKRAETMGQERLAAAAKKMIETKGPDGLSAAMRKRAELMGPERLRAAMMKRANSMGPEKMKAMANHAVHVRLNVLKPDICAYCKKLEGVERCAPLAARRA